MTLETFYLVCFIAGFVFTAISFFSGSMHLHLPGHGHFHFGGHGASGHGAGGHGAAHSGGAGGHGAHGTHGTTGAHSSTQTSHGARSGHTSDHFPFINPMTIAVFLAWFGGTGYLVAHSHLAVAAGLAISSFSGLTGAAIIFFFVAKFLMARDFTLNPDDFDMVGVLGTVSGVVHEGGIGEILFEQQGTRRACAARCETGSAIDKGEEVVVTRYENGVAYVRRWEELAGDAGILEEEERKQSQ